MINIKQITIIIFCLFFLCAVHDQSQKRSFTGSWYPYIDKTIEEEKMTYKEQYFSQNEFYFYQPILSMPYHYFIEGDKMYWLGLSKKDTLIIKKPILLDENTLKIIFKKSDKYIILKRVIDNNTLEDFVNQTIDEKTYYPSFLKRENYWKKYGKLPENGDFDNPPECKK